MGLKRWAGWLAILGFPAMMALVFTSQSYVTWMNREPNLIFAPVLVSSLLDWYIMALFVPMVVWLIRRFPPEGRRWWLGVLVHLPGFAVFFLLDQLFYLSADAVAGRLLGPEFSFAVRYAASYKMAGASIPTVLPHLIQQSFFYGTMVYALMVAIASTLEMYRRYRDRELQAVQLEERLARTRLQVLTMQLHPHFLFNTLNTISALMQRDVPAADRVVSRLGGLLRKSLHRPEIQMVPLGEELGTVRLYLDIEQTRFADRLEVQIQTDPEALEVMIPSLILLPLAENAITHGIARLTRTGRIELEARLAPGRLRIVLRNDGPVLPTGGLSPAEGLGLRNTRLRLTQLCGPTATLDFAWEPGGGARVTLDLPKDSARP
jgi:sensor histidine kinase YesM